MAITRIVFSISLHSVDREIPEKAGLLTTCDQQKSFRIVIGMFEDWENRSSQILVHHDTEFSGMAVLESLVFGIFLLFSNRICAINNIDKDMKIFKPMATCF